jgi:hypothetical protein
MILKWAIIIIVILLVLMTYTQFDLIDSITEIKAEFEDNSTEENVTEIVIDLENTTQYLNNSIDSSTQ